MKTLLKILAIAIALVVVIAVALPLFINVNSFRPQIESNLTSALGRPVKIGNLSLSVLSGSVGADELSIADDPKFSAAPFLTAKSLKVGVELLPLIFSKQLNVTELMIGDPEITLLRNREGVWNFSSLGNQAGQQAKTSAKSSGAPANVSVGKLDLRGGKISVGSVPPRRKPIVYDQLDVTMKDFSFTSAFPVVASARLPGGGSLKIDGTAGPINANDAALTPAQAKITLAKLDLAQSALVDPELGITGSADFEGTLSSDGRLAKANGTVRASQLKLVPKGSPAGQPVQIVFNVEHDLQKETGKLTRGDVGIGKALARLTGTYDMQGETTSVRMKLNGQAMPVDDLEAVLPAVGVVLPTGSKLKGGTLSIDLDIVGPLNKIFSAGSIRISNSSLAGFNLGSKLSAVSALSGKQTGNDMTIQNLSSDVRYAPEGTRLDKINLVVPSLGTVTGAGTVSPNNELDFSLIANLGGVAGGLTKAASLGGTSNGIPVKVSGTTSNPTFMPDVKGMVGSQLKGLVGGKSNPLGGLGGLLGKKKPD